jgi:phenol 2-monooxygenase
MIEDVFLEDLKARGVEVMRSSPFKSYSESRSPDTALINVEYTDLKRDKSETFRSQILVGCDGAHSKVRKAMPGSEISGEPGKAAWGVLDGESH